MSVRIPAGGQWRRGGCVLAAWVGFFGAGDAARSQPAAVAEEAVVSLPPVIVESRAKPLRWRYLSLPDVEVLSVCDDATSEAFLRRYHRIDQLLALILPKHFQARSSVRDTQILFNEELGRARSREVLDEMLRASPLRREANGRVSAPMQHVSPWQPAKAVQFLPNLRLADADSTSVFAVVAGPVDDEMDYTFHEKRIAMLLERRTPPLPAWFIAGVAGVYRRATLGQETVEIAAAEWTAGDETRALRRDEEHVRVLLPLGRLLGRGAPRQGSELTELDRVWLAQCALFVQWALADESGRRRDGLWTLVERLEKQPLDEALFEACLGLGYADARDRLSDFLSVAVNKGVTLRPEKLSEPPRIRARAASALEVARIRGEWERLEIRFVKQHLPELAGQYIEQARRTLRRAYDEGAREPELQALQGLTEIEAGNPDEARPLLEAAARGKVRRPRVYLELARLRLASTGAGSAEGRKLEAAEVAQVLEPLLFARTLEPPLVESYTLMADVWSRSSVAPQARDLALMAEVARYFPASSGLLLRVIHLHATNGAVGAIPSLARTGARHARDAEMRERFAEIGRRVVALEE